MRHSEGLRAASNAGPDYSGVVIGDYLEGGYFAGWVNYGNFNATSPSHGLIIAEQSARVSKQVNDTNSTVNLATNSQSDGLANMDSFVGSEWVAANYCRDYSKDGYSDWYIPSLMEWGVLAWNFCPDSSGTIAGPPNEYPFSDVGVATPSLPKPTSTNRPPRTSATLFQGTNAQSIRSMGPVQTSTVTYSTGQDVWYMNGLNWYCDQFSYGLLSGARCIPVRRFKA